MYLYQNFFIHSSVSGHLGCFYVLAVVTGAAMNNMSFSILVSSGYMPRSGIAGSYGGFRPTPVLLPGESQGQGSLVGFCLWGRTESDTTEATYQQQHHLLHVLMGEHL